MTSLSSIKIALCGALLLLFGSTVNADVYKWVDKNGKIQYSDQPPPSGDGKKLKRHSKDTVESPSAQSGATAGKPAASTADQELEYRKRKAEKEEAEKKQQAEAETAEKNKEYCNSLRGELSSHSNGVRLVRYNEKGERVFLDDKERAVSKEKLEQRISKECK
jgi:hypothetical protein